MFWRHKVHTAVEIIYYYLLLSYLLQNYAMLD